MNKKKKKKYRWLKLLSKIATSILFIFILLILFIRSQWGQDIIVDKLVSYISDKTGTVVNIDKAYITFSGNILLEDVYIEDQKQDTLLFSKKLEASIALMPLIRGKRYHLKSLDWTGVKANIIKTQETTSFNFNFIVEAFTSNNDSISQPTDSTQTVPIKIGNIALSDFDVIFLDENSGIDSSFNLGTLEVAVEDFDLESMFFEIDELEFTNSIINYNQTKPIISDTITSDDPLPVIKINALKIQDVKTNYKSIPEKNTLISDLSELIIESGTLDLEKQDFQIDVLTLNNSKISYTDLNKRVNDTVSKAPITFQWPKIKVKADLLSLQNNYIQYIANPNIKNTSGFNPNHIALKSLTLKASDLKLIQETANVDLNKLSFRDRSGFILHNLSSSIRINNTSGLALNDLVIKTNESNIKGGINLNYNSLTELINTPEKIIMNINLNTINVSLKDSYYFQPDIANNPYIDSLAQKNITGSLQLDGKISNLHTEETNLNWGAYTKIKLKGGIKNLLTEKELFIDSLYYNTSTIRDDIKNFINESELGITIPKKTSIIGQLDGSLENIKGNGTLNSSMGSISIKGNYMNKNTISFDGKLETSKFQLQKLLNNEQLGSISVSAKVSGSGTSLKTLNATFTSDFDQLTYNKYDFSNLELDGQITKGKGNINAQFKDDNLNLLIDTKVELDSVSPKINGLVNVKGADLNGLGITQELIKAQLKLFIDFEGNTDNFTFTSNVTDALVVKENEPYSVNDINISASSNELQTKASVHSRFLEANLSADADISKITSSIQTQLKSYISTSVVRDTIRKPVAMKMQVTLREKPILSNVFLPGIKKMDSITAVINFIEEKEILTASIKVPSIQYDNSSIDSLNLMINGDRKDLNFSLGWKNILSDPIHVNKTSIDGVLKDQTLLLDFGTNNETDEIARLRSELRLKNDTLYYRINPASVIFDKNPWSISENNQITIAKNYLSFRDFQLSQNQQRLKISSNDPAIDKEHINIEFQQFYLSTFTSILSNDEILANGLVNGELTIEKPFDETGLIADIAIDNLEVTEIPLGDLTLNATSKSFKNYDLALKLNGENAKLRLDGDYKASDTGANINLDFNLEELNIKVVEKFIDDQISDTRGKITGNAKITGTTQDPVYDGIFHFEKTSLLVNALNTRFTLAEENIKIDNSGLFLNDFTIADKNKNTFSLNGKIETETLNNPTFDLKLQTKNFQILNATREDNDLFYGKVKITADLDINGDLNVPKIRGNLAIDEGSDFTLIIPESELDIKEREGIVVFVNRENPDAIITRVEEDQFSTALLRGYDVNTRLKIDKGSVFKIIIDERSKDNFQISGKGEFKFGMEPNGRTTLSGRYDISDGHYEVSLYNIVKRRFKIAPGGSITWLGDPLDAKLDVTAIYEVETSASSLMSAKTSGESAGVVNQFRQKLPFLVYLNVDGELLEPAISFQLDMPEEEQGSLGGEVYGQVQQLNNQEEELNKQVFSLLVLNRFFPQSGSDGSNGGAVSIARDNVNKVLSGQLNNFSDKLIGDTGIELGFGLNSFTDYQGDSSQNRTQLEISAQKRLFNDRLIVQVGSDVDIEGSSQNSEESTPVIGNVSLEYLLSKNGRYRLKGFRKNEFESVIDGQLVVTGIALIFNKEFNKFKELFSKSVAKEIDNQKTTNKKKN
ncbi:translocation/assembly module TamB [uncultured Aquimarina sp.]|uniref:translocation/assembly module TamB domain-containing protein n=1 Tax=uncultured Aquimarina sp. TaxID=575652 RepID=UPI00261A4746|nr:translocation/assembly module TamB [uncultured Aquimarina sp.]